MRKILPWMSLFIIVVLVACSYPGAPVAKPQTQSATATLSADQMQTQISQMLTVMPTNTGAPQSASSPTAALPTVMVDTPTQKAAAGQVETATTAPQAASTNTPEPAKPTVTKIPPTAEAPAVAATVTNTPKPAGPTATTVPGDPAVTLGDPNDTDTMRDPRAWNWPTGFDEFTSATFRSDGQYIKALTTKDGWRLANPLGRDFGNIYLEATFNSKACQQGSAYEADHYGLMVRVPVLEDPMQGYLFGINCNGQYSLRSWDWNLKEPPKKEMGTLIDWTASKFINAGQNKVNRIGIMLQGTRMTMYANGHKLGQTYDYEQHNVLQLPLTGFFGVFVGSRTGDDFTVQVKSISYWENP